MATIPGLPLWLQRKTFSRTIRRICLHRSLISETFTQGEYALINALIGIQGRGRAASPAQLKEVERAEMVLEGVPNPTGSSLIEGRWQLMLTTRPGTASPIQRTFVGVDSFSVFQEIARYHILLRTADPRVLAQLTCVAACFKYCEILEPYGELKVEAVASIKDGKHILFQLDRAAFSFKFLPFKIPYPVPFRLLGDEGKGWLDTTYLSRSGNIRISRMKQGVDEFLKLNQDVTERELELLEESGK